LCNQCAAGLSQGQKYSKQGDESRRFAVCCLLKLERRERDRERGREREIESGERVKGRAGESDCKRE